MKNVESVNQLRDAISSNEPEIQLIGKPLIDQVVRFKGIPKTTITLLIVSLGFGTVNPLVGGATFVASMAWFGRGPIELGVGLGGKTSRELYFSYDLTTADGQTVLRRKP